LNNFNIIFLFQKRLLLLQNQMKNMKNLINYKMFNMYLKIKLWYIRKYFDIRFPINCTNSIVWINQYNTHLKKVKKIQNDIKVYHFV